MITATIEEVGTRFLELISAVEERGETILICRGGKAVAEMTPPSERAVDRLKPYADLKPLWVEPDFDPVVPATEEEWPEEWR